MNILIIGTGAVGSFYGSLLARTGARVSVMARSDHAVIQEHGIEIHSDTPLGTYHFHPAAVLRMGELPDEMPDYVLLCIKVTEEANRVALLRPVLGRQTRIVLISNGVEIEDEIHQAFPDQPLISGLAFICVTRTAPGKIWHQSQGRLVLGDYPCGISEETRLLVEAYQRAGISCHASSDITTARWQKCLWNAAFNPVSVLSGGLDTARILHSQEPFIRAIMEEICQIAAACGHPLDTDLVSKMIDNTRTMPPYKTSMLHDFEAGRPLETEAIIGNAVRAARKAAVSAPRLESLYALIKLKEQAGV